MTTYSSIDLLNFSGCFVPTKTTGFVLDAAKKNLQSGDDVLDLGCGCGVIGIELKLYKQNINIHFSDISQSAIHTAERNLNILDIAGQIRQSNLLDAWDGMKFDMIVDDVSGITEKIAEQTPWFDNVPCNTGASGLDLTEEVIIKSESFLKDDGCLILPYISLSSRKVFNNILQKYNHELISHKEWPLPPELVKFKEKLIHLHNSDLIDIKQKFGMLIAYTEIYKISY